MKITIEHYEITVSFEQPDDDCDADKMAYMLVQAMIATGFSVDSAYNAFQDEIDARRNMVINGL